MAFSRTDFTAGVRDGLPFVVGNVPYGIVAGIATVGAGFTDLQAASMAAAVFAGASQLAAVDLVGAAPLAVVVATGLLVNLRLLMYSASIAPYFRHLSGPWRWSLAAVLTDPVYALSVAKFEEDDSTARRWYYLGTAVPVWTSWVVSVALGAALGVGVPEELRLEFAVPLVFLGLLASAVEDRAALSAAVVAGGVAVVGAGWPFNAGLLVASVAGIGVAVLVDRRAA